MKPIAFIDTEIDPNNNRVLDIGAIKENGNQFHSRSVSDFIHFLKGSEFICGHNLLNHDIKYLGHAVKAAGINDSKCIDTLFLSPLLFPAKPYHALLKDDKLQTDDLNNPLNDSKKARDLFHDEVAAFHNADSDFKAILYLLLHKQKEFRAFFDFICYSVDSKDVAEWIRYKFNSEICANVNLNRLVSENPIELSYSLAIINCNNRYSITPPWVMKKFPEVDRIMNQLRNKPCVTGCSYCDQALDIHKGLKAFFGFDAFRTYAGEALQADAVKAAIDNRSMLAVFPTGGGKSVTFQVPALMSGVAVKGLTVVISPLQSLMKDQVDNLEKIGITEAVTINGLLDPIERGKSFERVEDGSASLLYISPESLRSRTIERLLLERKIVRFVIDEAHCFSSWGQDFRVDYLYIGDFIKRLQQLKELDDPIPVSCFTATAKRNVIEDIADYFKEKLGLDLEVFSTGTSRTNLTYKVYERDNEDEKYNTVRDLIEAKKCPTIIYVSRTKRAYSLATKLSGDGFLAKPYHGKMDKKEKSENQDAFINGEVPVMVATSAFGMGVDKKDVGMVIHYDISDSLENYIQEAGRAGRDEKIVADCFVLFNEEDLSKHFILLNQTKLSIKEIGQVWKAIKELTRFRSMVSNSALEIARKAGWDENVNEIETRVKTAIAALEESGYLKRGQNNPRIFANSILSKTAQEAIDKIHNSKKFEEKQKEKAVRIIKKLFSGKSKKQSADEVAETRVDYISDHLGIVKEEVINIISLLREEKILADAKDLTAFIRKSESVNRSLKIFESFTQIEKFLLRFIDREEKTLDIKSLNQQAETEGYKDVSPNKIKTIINFWAIKNWVKRHNEEHSRNHVSIVSLQDKDVLSDKLERRRQVGQLILEILYAKITDVDTDNTKEELLVEFSIHELKSEIENSLQLFQLKPSIEDIEDTLFYLSRIEAIKIEGGFLVVYNSLTIDRLEQDNRKQYKIDDYKKLNLFYENKIQQIHIVGEYAKKMIDDYKGALQFVDDYFQLNYSSFLNKYFPGSKQNDIRRNITPAKFRQLFGELSPRQLEIIKDQTQHIAVLAGPGSGKTKVLVHKLASLLLMEDVKHEQLLMVTFSRAAATEFKQRLIKLIGNAAYYIEMKTFHSFCFDLLGRVGSLDKSTAIIKNTIEKIKNGEVEVSKITRTVLVIDEAQDIDQDEFELINTFITQNQEMRVIAVGDDDQNIYEFRGASAKYLSEFIKEREAATHELIENYRSKSNLVEFSNGFVKNIISRLKVSPIVANQNLNGHIKIVKHQYGHLITPLVKDIATTGLSGTTCVLTQNNDEALQVTGLLLKNGLHAKLIQSNEGFNLYNLVEVRFFLSQMQLPNDVYLIADEVWETAKTNLRYKFARSNKLELINNLLRNFESINSKKKYKSDFESFLRESKLEDFYRGNSETIFVSTIHKAKGKEFDNVFLLLDNFNPATDEKKRLLYVAMTRAKTNLTIHLNGNYLDDIHAENLIRDSDKELHSLPAQIALYVTHADVVLDHFIYRQNLICQLMSGDSVTPTEEDCRNNSGETVLKYSKQFLLKIEKLRTKGYHPAHAKVNFIIKWKKEETGLEYDIVLPEVYMEKIQEAR